MNMHVSKRHHNIKVMSKPNQMVKSYVHVMCLFAPLISTVTVNYRREIMEKTYTLEDIDIISFNTLII